MAVTGPRRLKPPWAWNWRPSRQDPENQNLVPNRSLITAPQHITLAPGDWVFMPPKQSNALFQFEEILLVRGGRLQEQRWRAFPRRY